MVFTALTSKYTFNLHPDAGQVFWCTADCGWITGHSYIVYGILPSRVPTLMYEGAPNYPAEDAVLAGRAPPQGHALLHRADGDPLVHEVGR
jgi:acyl-coenzyme A synthetase/AMP-(fatty) acid ligase